MRKTYLISNGNPQKFHQDLNAFIEWVEKEPNLEFKEVQFSAAATAHVLYYSALIIYVDHFKPE